MSATPGPPDLGLQGSTSLGELSPPYAHGTGEARVPGSWELSENGVRNLVPEDTSSWLLGVPGAMAAWTPTPRQGKPEEARCPPRTCLPLQLERLFTKTFSLY